MSNASLRQTKIFDLATSNVILIFCVRVRELVLYVRFYVCVCVEPVGVDRMGVGEIYKTTKFDENRREITDKTEVETGIMS